MEIFTPITTGTCRGKSQDDVVINVIFSDKKTNSQTFSISFSEKAKKRVFGKSISAVFGYDTAQPTRSYFASAVGGYTLGQASKETTRWIVRATSLYRGILEKGKRSPEDFTGRFKVEFDKARNMFYVDCGTFSTFGKNT